jgi:hypothetical protein
VLDECPRCGWHPDHAYRVDRELTRLKEVIADRQITVILSTKIKPVDAAILLGRSPETLKGWRAELKYRHLHDKLGGRIYYDIREIAEFIVAGPQE